MEIFRRVKLHSNQLRTVADRRFHDAATLRDTGRNERANGAIYLGGFVVECMLKAKLLDNYPWLGSASSPEGRPAEERHLWSLCYRSHDLDEILAKLPSVLNKLSALEQRHAPRLTQSLKSICAQWTIFVRYSPYNADIDDARTFLAQIEELKPWLR